MKIKTFLAREIFSHKNHMNHHWRQYNNNKCWFLYVICIILYIVYNNELIYLIIIYIRRQCVCIINSFFLVFINTQQRTQQYVCLYAQNVYLPLLFTWGHQDSERTPQLLIYIYWKLSLWKKRKNNLINKRRYTTHRLCRRLPYVLYDVSRMQDICIYAYARKYADEKLWEIT